jgi:hypothetical protein
VIAALNPRPLFPLRPQGLAPLHLELSKALRNPMQPMFEFNPFAHRVRGWTIVWGHGPEHAQHQRTGHRGRPTL